MFEAVQLTIASTKRSFSPRNPTVDLTLPKVGRFAVSIAPISSFHLPSAMPDYNIRPSEQPSRQPNLSIYMYYHRPSEMNAYMHTHDQMRP